MAQPNRREMLGTLGTLATVGGWIGLSAAETLAQNEIRSTESKALDPAQEYTLPPLPYAVDALEPYIDAQTMTLHHGKHHASYVKGLNDALAKLAEARKGGKESPNLGQIRGLTDALSFHGSGHTLHTIFWNNMGKDAGGMPQREILSFIRRDFGDFGAFLGQFTQAAVTVQGSGWAILAWEPLSGRLIVLSTEKHQNQTMYGCVPLLVLDVWEHAYYLKYQNDRTKYVENFWRIVNWENVESRLIAAQKLTA
jgi:Fe-Mn family superoxide dismutase